MFRVRGLLKKAGWLLLALLLVLPVSCLWPNEGMRGVLKIGLVAPFSGPETPEGYNLLFAVRLAVSQWNKAGGKGGYTLTFVAQDERDGVADGVTQAKKMALDPDIIGVVGHPGSASAASVEQTYAEAGLAAMLLGPRSEDASQDRSATSFWLAPSLQEIGEGAARFLSGELGVQQAILVVQNERLMPALSQSLARGLEKRGVGTILISVERGQVAFPEVVARLSGRSSSALVYLGEGTQAGDLLLGLRRSGAQTLFLCLWGCVNQDLLRVAGDEANGAYFVTSSPFPQDLPNSGAFVHEFHDVGGADPWSQGALAYDATQALMEALQRVIASGQKPDRAKVLKALKEFREFRGVTGVVRFDDKLRRVGARPAIYQVAASRFPGVLQQEAP